MIAQFRVSTTEYMVVPFRRKEKKEQVWGRGYGHRKKIISVFCSATQCTYKKSSMDIL